MDSGVINLTYKPITVYAKINKVVKIYENARSTQRQLQVKIYWLDFEFEHLLPSMKLKLMCVGKDF